MGLIQTSARQQARIKTADNSEAIYRKPVDRSTKRQQSADTEAAL